MLSLDLDHLTSGVTVEEAFSLNVELFTRRKSYLKVWLVVPDGWLPRYLDWFVLPSNSLLVKVVGQPLLERTGESATLVLLASSHCFALLCS